MKKIHHATQKKATEAGIELAIDGENYVATDISSDRVLYAGSVTPQEVLEAAIEVKEELDENGEPESSKSVIKQQKKDEYKAFNNSCGDDIAELMRSATTGAKGKCDPDELMAVAVANGVEERLQGYIDNGRNVGMCRMNIGNVLRGLHRNGHDVMIDGQTIVGAEIDL